MRINLLSFAVLLILLSGCKKQDFSVYDLVCEGLPNPQGIDKTTPRFGWKVSSSKNGTEQKAYQVLVASDVKRLSENSADLWNSGKVESASSVFIPYSGKNLQPGYPAVWKVRIWDETGNASDWSQPASFGIGLQSETDWQAKYIGFPTEAGYSECPQLYKSFETEESGSKWILHVNSLGYHEIYINREKVGKGVLTPAVSQFNKRSLVNTYDVTPLIKKGRNDLIIWLGSGWYTIGLPGVVNNGPVVKAQLESVENNQRTVILTTDSDWLGRKSSYTRHGDWSAHHFGGEIIDGSLAKSDLSAENNAERTWFPVTVIDVPPHNVSQQMSELNAIRDTLEPVSVVQLAKDTFLVDFGKNLTGWFEIRFPKLAEKQEITLEYYDHQDKNGKFNDRKQLDKYLASGAGNEVFINKFNYHGFRYVRISNLNEAPGKNSMRAYLVHTDYELAADFECSDPDLNQIHNMLFHTLRCLSIGGDLVDCPQIERLGYGGDGNASTVTAQTMFNLGPMYNNWLQVWADVIREDGGMPHTAPNPYPAGGGPYWCGFIITATWNTFLNYGDTLLLKKYYPVMQKWLGYVDQYSVDGLLKKWPDTDYRGWYLGDWATPAGIDQTNMASVDVVNNSFLAVCLNDMQKIAGILGNHDDENLYAIKKKQLQKKIHETYFNETNSTYGTGVQTDLAFPLISGVVPEDKIDKVTQSFYTETEVNRNGHFACGLVGLPVITEWAVKNMAADLMYSMMKKRDFPGYLYMIDNGGTTTWEHWKGERSYIHNCYNGTGSWFYNAVGGISPAEDVPAWQKVRIQPQIPEGVTWAKTSKETPFGKLAVNWELKEKVLEMQLEIPVGIEAAVVLPGNTKKYRLNGAEKQLQEEQVNNVILKSGKYKISYKL